MKTHVFLVALVVLMSCDNEEAFKPGTKEFKKISLSFQGIKISSSNLNGGRATEEEQQPTYLFIEIKKGEEYYATGVFKEIPATLDLKLPSNSQFTIYAKAIRKGSSYGIRYTKSGIYTNINWSDAADSLNFQNPMHNGADAGSCYVYTAPDSSASAFEYYATTDTFAAKLSVDTDDVTDTLEMELERKVFGIESRLRNFTKGSVRVLLSGETNALDEMGISSQVINYPDTAKLSLFSLMVLHPPRPNVRLRVVYNNTEKDQVIFDGFVEMEALEKKILDIDLSRFDAGGRLMDFTLEEGSLSEGELIEIN